MTTEPREPTTEMTTEERLVAKYREQCGTPNKGLEKYLGMTPRQRHFVGMWICDEDLDHLKATFPALPFMEFDDYLDEVEAAEKTPNLCSDDVDDYSDPEMPENY